MTKATPIPTKSREVVKKRQLGRCLRCGCPVVPAGEYHHRRARGVRDPHTHCPCNGIYLCTKCHTDVTSGDVLGARRVGLVIARHEREPWTVPVLSHYGLITLSCDGGFEYVIEVPDSVD